MSEQMVKKVMRLEQGQISDAEYADTLRFASEYLIIKKDWDRLRTITNKAVLDILGEDPESKEEVSPTLEDVQQRVTSTLIDLDKEQEAYIQPVSEEIEIEETIIPSEKTVDNSATPAKKKPRKKTIKNNKKK